MVQYLKTQWFWLAVVAASLTLLFTLPTRNALKVQPAQALHLQSAPLAAAFVELQAEFIVSQLALSAKKPVDQKATRDLCDRAQSAYDRMQKTMAEARKPSSASKDQNLKSLQAKLKWLKTECAHLTDSDIPSIQELQSLARQVRAQLSLLPGKSRTLKVANAVSGITLGTGLN